MHACLKVVISLDRSRHSGFHIFRDLLLTDPEHAFKHRALDENGLWIIALFHNNKCLFLCQYLGKFCARSYPLAKKCWKYLLIFRCHTRHLGGRGIA